MFNNCTRTMLALPLLAYFVCLSDAEVSSYHLPSRTLQSTRPQRSPPTRSRPSQRPYTVQEINGQGHQENSWRPRPWWPEVDVQPYSLNNIQTSTNGQCLRVTYCKRDNQRQDPRTIRTYETRNVFRRFVRPTSRIRDYFYEPFPEVTIPTLPPLLDEKMDELKALKESLGDGATYVYDNTGEVIGVTSSQLEIIPPPRPKPGPERPKPSTPGDSDVCCTTREAYFINSTLEDLHGRVRRIAQYKQMGSYQIIRHGMCGTKGGCRGECREKQVLMQLMVHPPENGQKVTLKFFKVPAYCVCHNFAS